MQINTTIEVSSRQMELIGNQIKIPLNIFQDGRKIGEDFIWINKELCLQN